LTIFYKFSIKVSPRSTTWSPGAGTARARQDCSTDERLTFAFGAMTYPWIGQDGIDSACPRASQR